MCRWMPGCWPGRACAASAASVDRRQGEGAIMRSGIAAKGDNRRIHALLAEYGECHPNGTNKLIHLIAVPALLWTIVALLRAPPAADAVAAGPHPKRRP